MPDATDVIKKAKERAAKAWEAVRVGYNPIGTIQSVYYGAHQDGTKAERERCISIIREWIHGAPTTTTENVLTACIEQIAADGDELAVKSG